MNVMLAIVDGNVNADRWDTVEYWVSNKGWVSKFFQRVTLDGNMPQAVLSDHAGWSFSVSLSLVRHAQHGSGHLRLQNAYLRAFFENIRSGGDVGMVYDQDIDTFLKWLDEYEYTRFEEVMK